MDAAKPKLWAAIRRCVLSRGRQLQKSVWISGVSRCRRCIDGVMIAKPTRAQLWSMRPGRDNAVVFPPRSKPDQWGETHCPFPVRLTYELTFTSWCLLGIQPSSRSAHDRERWDRSDEAAVRPSRTDIPHPPSRAATGRIEDLSGLRCHTATGSTNLRCGVPYIPTFPYDDSDSRRWFLCDSATCLLVAGVDTLGGREGEP